MTTLNAANALLVIAALLGLVFGGRYLSARTFMPYQATAAGKSWSELDARDSQFCFFQIDVAA
jgi:hypothetical protein